MDAIFRFSFTSEIYGAGHYFRKRGHYPKFLPLFFTSDHGVSIGSKKIEEDSTKDISRLYLTWSSKIAIDPANKIGSKVIGITHPWLYYARRYGWHQSANAKGTVFFPFHTVPGVISKGYSDKANLVYLTNLPPRFKPIKVCLHNHDMGTLRQKFYEENGFKVVSAGNGQDHIFLEKLYIILNGAKYSISESFGSQVAYAVQLGIPSQILHRDLLLSREEDPDVQLNSDDPEFIKNLPSMSKLFADAPTEITEEQRLQIEEILGASFKFSKIKILIACWTSLVNPGARILAIRVLTRIKTRLKAATA